MGKIIFIKGANYANVAVSKISSETAITDFAKNDGQYYDLKLEKLVNNQYYWYTELNIPSGSLTLTCMFPKTTSGGLGVEFRDSSNLKISNYANIGGNNGDIVTCNIPSGAVKIVFSYLNEKGCKIENAPTFEGFYFNTESLTS